MSRAGTIGTIGAAVIAGTVFWRPELVLIAALISAGAWIGAALLEGARPSVVRAGAALADTVTGPLQRKLGATTVRNVDPAIRATLAGAMLATTRDGTPDWPTRVQAAKALAALGLEGRDARPASDGDHDLSGAPGMT